MSQSALRGLQCLLGFQGSLLGLPPLSILQQLEVGRHACIVREDVVVVLLHPAEREQAEDSNSMTLAIQGPSISSCSQRVW